MSTDTAILEAVAGEAVRAALGGVAVRRRDVRGAPPGTHDLDVVLADRTEIAVEVTQSTEPNVRRFWAEVQRHDWAAPELSASWGLMIESDAVDVGHLRGGIGAALAALELAGITSFNAREPRDGPQEAALDNLARLGVRLARQQETMGAPAMVLVGMSGPASFTSSAAIVSAVECEATKRDNCSKLEAAGGGHLFVWIDAAQVDAYGALCGGVEVPRDPPALPSGVLTAWVARYPVPRPDGTWSAPVVLRGSADGWVNVTREVHRCARWPGWAEVVGKV